MSLENQDYSNDKGQRNQRRKIRNYYYSLRLYYKKQNQAKGMYWNIVDKMGYAPDRRLERDKWVKSQAAQTLFVIYIRDCIALRFQRFKRMYENGSKIALNSTCSKGLNKRSLP